MSERDVAPEAKTEFVHGPLIEYTGSHLALMKLAKATLAFTLTFFAAILFFYMPPVFKDSITSLKILIHTYEYSPCPRKRS